MTIQEVIEAHCEYGEMRSYSGRGMYGKECLGVTVDDPYRFMMELGYGIGVEESECAEGLRLPAVQVDSLGLSSIVYFPKEKYDEV